ncbi:MAG: 5-deoxy-glucuronate isomerase [Clostridia bacterium]|nr:5-deoxy-glucuronate isomerase [Clostridia bacterium]
MSFSYPQFDSNGVKTLTSIGGKDGDMLMDISVVKVAAGDKRKYGYKDKEVCVLLTEGGINMRCGDVCGNAYRSDVYTDLPVALHVCAGDTAEIEAVTDCEILVIATINDRRFPAKFYDKQDVVRTTSCEGMWENTAVRDVNTVFDYSIAPYSNLVVGEVIARQGRWWSYLPHSHPQPEVYYYKMPAPEAFGACFIGEMNPYTIKDGSVGCFVGGVTHVQVTAPGYPMYCCWMIRHLDGNPWDKTRIVDERYKHLED